MVSPQIEWLKLRLKADIIKSGSETSGNNSG
jgi:hypothetical protein